MGIYFSTRNLMKSRYKASTLWKFSTELRCKHALDFKDLVGKKVKRLSSIFLIFDYLFLHGY